jgi:carbamoyltransferase
MVLTARAKAEAFSAIPSVIHHDGTSRVQIVRKNADPLIHAYLKAMGRRVGVEVSVNTSLNVGAPIAQTPTQALETLQRSKGMHGLFMIAEEGDAFLAWHHIEAPPKDAGRTLNQWVAEWRDLHVRK